MSVAPAAAEQAVIATSEREAISSRYRQGQRLNKQSSSPVFVLANGFRSYGPWQKSRPTVNNDARSRSYMPLLSSNSGGVQVSETTDGGSTNVLDKAAIHVQQVRGHGEGLLTSPFNFRCFPNSRRHGRQLHSRNDIGIFTQPSGSTDASLFRKVIGNSGVFRRNRSSPSINFSCREGR